MTCIPENRLRKSLMRRENVVNELFLVNFLLKYKIYLENAKIKIQLDKFSPT